MRRGGPYSEQVLTKICGISRKHLRYWRKIGLFPPRDKRFFRGYRFIDLLSVKVILRLKKGGVRVGLIKKSLDAIEDREGINNPLVEKKLSAWRGKIYYLKNGTIYEALTGQSTLFKIRNDEEELRSQLLEMYESIEEGRQVRIAKRK